jgi:ribonuclease P protein component
MRFTRHQRLRRPAEFAGVRTFGCGRESGPFLWQLRCFGAERQPANRRLGVIASRRIGNAVARNRAKRRLRALFQSCQAALPDNCDLVLVARRGILTASFADLQEAFMRCVRKPGAFPKV